MKAADSFAAAAVLVFHEVLHVEGEAMDEEYLCEFVIFVNL